MDEHVGSRTVSDTAEKMGVNRTYVTNTTKNIMRKLRWTNRIPAIKRFFDEYSKFTA